MRRFKTRPGSETVFRALTVVFLLVFVLLFLACPGSTPGGNNDDNGNGNGNGNGDDNGNGSDETVFRRILGTVPSAATAGTRQATPAASIADQIWVVPVYHRIGGFETGISFMSMPIPIDIEADGSFEFAYADQNAPEGVFVIDAFVPEYSHATDENPNDRSVFSGSVILLLINSDNAGSEDIEDRKQAILGFIALPAAASAATLITVPVSALEDEAEIDLGEIEDADVAQEALADATIEDVQEYLSVSLQVLMEMAATGSVLKTMGNFIVNDTIRQAGVSPDDPDYLHWSASIHHTGFFADAMQANVTGGDRTVETDPEVHEAIRIWNPGEPSTAFGDDAMRYMGYRVGFGSSEDLFGATVTIPEEVSFDGPLQGHVYPGNRSLLFPDPDNGYITPGAQNQVQEGWWTIETGSGKQGAFQMDAAQIFDTNGALRVLIPKVEFDVSEEIHSIELWKVSPGGLTVGDEVNLTEIAEDAGSNHFANLQVLNGLRITWYLRDPQTGNYEKASNDFVKLALGYVGISISPQYTGAFAAPQRYKTPEEIGATHKVILIDTGSTQYQALEIITGKENFREPAAGYDEWTQMMMWKNFIASDDLDIDGSFIWEFPEGFQFYFSPDSHRQESPGEGEEKTWPIHNRGSSDLNVKIRNGEDVEYWDSVPNLVSLGAIHINYSMHGVGLKFNFGKDR